MRVPLIPLLLASLFAGPVSGQSLTLRDSWPWPGPESVAWDAELCGLWVAGADREAVLLAPDGTEQLRLQSDLLTISAVTPGEHGILLVSLSGAAQWMGRDGEERSSVFRLPLGDAEGVTALPGGDLLVVQDDPDTLIRLTPAEAPGYVVQASGRTSALAPGFTEPQGIAVDPTSGTMLVVDDEQGTSSLYELTPAGQILSRTPLTSFGRDPEGVAFHPATGTLWIAFDEGGTIGVFDYLPSHGMIAEPDHCVPSLS